MKWVEIITLRSPAKNSLEFLDALSRKIGDSDVPNNLIALRIYHHSVVETDVSIHIYWEAEKETPRKSPLGLRFVSALKSFGLLHHSVWAEATAQEINRQAQCSAEIRD